MANEEHLAILKQGVETWNMWRRMFPDMVPDLNGANLSEVNLDGALLDLVNLSRANLIGARMYQARLSWANLFEADLSKADLPLATLHNADLTESKLIGANLHRADLFETKLERANLDDADLDEANLSNANLSGAILRRANLQGANLTDSDLSRADLSGARIFGVSAWKLILDEAIQSNLIVTEEGEPVITVDSLEIAQFVYLLLHNQKIRDVIETIGKKVVLILGRFTDERKAVLDAIRDALRQRDYIPILFDFDKSENRDLTETIVTLAHLSRFIIADITDAKSIPQELQAIVPNLPSVVVQPVIQQADFEYAMFEHIRRYPWVLPVYQYETQDSLLAVLSEKVILPAENKVNELRSGH